MTAMAAASGSQPSICARTCAAALSGAAVICRVIRPLTASRTSSVAAVTMVLKKKIRRFMEPPPVGK